jgi:outer membrane protein OmpA-like peptidoglycan-associated protein
MKAITQAPSPCSQRFTVGADALFEFDKSTLNSFAKETLNALKPLLVKLGSHPVKVEGHTDSKGTDQYNQTLSEKRAEQVKNWLIENGVASTAAISTKGFGSLRPVARNANPDGSDNPEGRAKNRRVEIVVDTCTKLEQVPKASSTDGGSKSP